MTPSVKGTQTEQNLKAAFANESQAVLRYMYFGNMSDIAGDGETASIFRVTAEGDTGHAYEHLRHLLEFGSGDPATGMPIQSMIQVLESVVHSETHESSNIYPAMAKTARDEGFDKIADWFESLAKSGRHHATRYNRALEAAKVL
jgi:rubrerythrin